MIVKKSAYLSLVLYISLYTIVMFFLTGEMDFQYYYFHVFIFWAAILTVFIYFIYKNDILYENDMLKTRHKSFYQLYLIRLKNVIFASCFITVCIFVCFSLLNMAIHKSIDLNVYIGFLNLFFGFLFISLVMRLLTLFFAYNTAYIILFFLIATDGMLTSGYIRSNLNIFYMNMLSLHNAHVDQVLANLMRLSFKCFVVFSIGYWKIRFKRFSSDV
jgi:hypothetical protein